MAEPQQDLAVVRTRRLEIVDDHGRVRAALSATDTGSSRQELAGLEIFDRHGRARAWLIDLGDVAQLALAVEGDQVAILETVDAAEGESSTSLALCDRIGQPVVSWSVAGDGALSSATDPVDGD